MKTPIIVSALCLAAILLAGGCDAVRPIREASDEGTVVEVAVFEGGYGIDWHQKVAANYSAEHADQGVRVNLWGDPRIEEKIKPRLLRGDPPDLILPIQLPIWLLISAGKLRPYDAFLDEPAHGSDRPWRDWFMPGALDTFSSDGHVYAIPSTLGVWVCWYDARLFREHGWEVPETWGGFLDLCEEIQQAGIAPLAFQGKAAIYAWFLYMTLTQRLGTLEAINRMNALEPGAFSHPDSVRAAGMVQDLALKYFQKGAMAMGHTDSQLEFVNHRAAMVFCGVWLENEMKASIPPDFEMRCFKIPAVEGGRGNPNLVNGMTGEYLIVPVDARHPDEAMDFCRYLVSPVQAPDMGACIGVISPLRGATPREAVTPALQDVLDILEAAPGTFDVRLNTLLLEWVSEVQAPALGALLRGEIMPEEFGERLDAGVAKSLRNPDLIIPPFVPYDPAAFGESP